VQCRCLVRETRKSSIAIIVQNARTTTCTDLYATETRSAAADGGAGDASRPRSENGINRNHPQEKRSMAIRLKPIKDQVIVITGASSGIGLATALEAARRGARVVLASRDEADIKKAADQITADGGQATPVVVDVGDQGSVEALAEQAIVAYERIDTWVNNAGVSIYGKLEEVPLDDAHRLFETNYWGVVHGSLAAVPYLKQHGGALINVGSELSETAMPLQGHYAASKHAVKGFTDTLRMELHKDGAPISVTLIQPAAIDTPYPEHAMNYLGVEPKHAPPVYAPEIVAEAILACAESPRRNLRVGGAAKMFTAMEKVAPAIGDRMKERTAFDQQRTDEAPLDDDTLYSPRPGDGRVRGNYPGRVMKRSLYTAAALNPMKTLLGAAAIVGIAGVLSARRN
jgi:NAD(P)-dependent dehydrogenase (short-subunit alcohol dehydrogenase family)